MYEAESITSFEDSAIHPDEESNNDSLSFALDMQDIQAELIKKAENLAAAGEVITDPSVKQNLGYDENGILRTMPCEYKYTERKTYYNWGGANGYAILRVTIRGTVDVQNGTVLTLEPLEIDVVDSMNTSRNCLKVIRNKCSKSNKTITYLVEGTIAFEKRDEDGNLNTSKVDFSMGDTFEAQDYIL